jgi:hypothetical protein
MTILPSPYTSSYPFTLVSFTEQTSRLLLRLLDSTAATSDQLRYSDRQRLARSLRRVQRACQEHLERLEQLKSLEADK